MTSTAPPVPTWSEAKRIRRGAVPVAVFLGALGLRLWGINFGLPALYRPDEDVTVGRAMGVLHGVFDPRFADWPHLYFYLAAAWLAPLHWIGLVSDQASGYLGVRVLDALLGSIAVLLVYEFGHRAYGRLSGIFGGIALAAAFLAVRDSHFATLDIPLSLACIAALYVAYRTIESPQRLSVLLNGLMLGLAAAVKYNGALVLSGIAAAQVMAARLHRARTWSVIRPIALIGLIGFAVLLLTSPFLLFDPAITQHGIGYIFLHLAEPTAPSIGWVQLSKALWYGLDPPLLLIALAGVALAAWRRQAADLVVLAFLILYFVLVGVGGSVFFRYADPLIPPLALLGGRALATLVEATAPGRMRWLGLAAAGAVLLVPPLAHDVRYDLLIQQTDTRTLAYDWLNANVPPGIPAAIPYMAGPAHDQRMVDSREHSHSASDPYVASFLDSRLETRYPVVELMNNDLQLTSLDKLRQQGVRYVVVGYERPGTGCTVESPLERLLQREAQLVASFSPTSGCPNSVFDPIDTYYVPLAGYGGWLRPGPPLRIYRLAG